MITPDLKLIIPLRQNEKGETTIHGYHTPISPEVFRANFRVLASAKTALMKDGPMGAYLTGGTTAALYLDDAGKAEAAARGEEGNTAAPLLAEFRRLTMVLAPGASGYEMLPVDNAIAQGKIDMEDWREAEAGIAFFTCFYATARRAEKEKDARMVAGALQASITSLSAMEWIASLQKQTEEKNMPAAASSVPS